MEEDDAEEVDVVVNGEAIGLLLVVVFYLHLAAVAEGGPHYHHHHHLLLHETNTIAHQWVNQLIVLANPKSFVDFKLN